MKRTILIFSIIFLLLTGCQSRPVSAVAASTLPVYEFAAALCEHTDVTVTRLVTENVSCLHDYTLKVDQMRAIEGAQLVLINGVGLEDFMADALDKANAVSSAADGMQLLHGHHHDHEGQGHTHSDDPHIWLSPENAKHMAKNLCKALCAKFPQWEATFKSNLTGLLARLDALQDYGRQALAELSCRELVTFHDGFGYLAESFDLTILRAVEEESGSEASAAELIGLIRLVREHDLPAIFVEANGSDSAANIISAETGVQVYVLDMAMSGDSYFDAMYRNIDTLREALQ